MKFELIKKVPIVGIDGKRCLVDTGYPDAFMSAKAVVQKFFGIPGLHVAGVQALKRYTKFDYRSNEITTSDEPIPLEGGSAVPLEVRPTGWLVKMTVGGVEGLRYIDTGAAFSYVHNISKDFLPAAPPTSALLTAGLGRLMRRVPCEFAGHQFEILCGDAQDNPAYVPPEGVIGYDFFANFTLVVDRVGEMTFVKK